MRILVLGIVMVFFLGCKEGKTEKKEDIKSQKKPNIVLI